ncbi:Glycosyltransferase, GT2 family [Pseudomonas sp. NFACC49-2]|uniref:glycosyltransferase n=1 Tax=Pseudomonas sp. NFACC49-2 TaxID=1566222 RepID=UPI00090EE62E|nr:glycosyltransferase [Pseudomonas sp. NFACC49-2]SFX09002.1 Glycosyltransferase, GT2 family [Pseudomonas sp. NFACC49-2]
MSNLAQQDAYSLEQALARLRLMYAKPEHPYYFLAPAYRESSSGVVSLHYLCHMLNLSGREAYICGTEVVNPDLKTPLINSTIKQRHAAAGKVPIAVYPEVFPGNPLNCSVVARFLLNFEGFLTGNGMDAAPTDLFFYYAARLAEHRGDPDGDLLCLPAIDVEMFSTVGTATERKGSYLYQNRHPLGLIDYSQLPADIRLLSMANPLPLPELAKLLRGAEVMYSYEWSMTCVMAVLCGCPVIFIPGHGVDQPLLDTSFFGSVGFAMLDQPDPLGHARASLGDALQRYVERTASFWQQLDVFIAKTQATAAREAVGNRLGALDWLRKRYPTAQQLLLINERLSVPAAPAFTVVVRDDGNQLALAHTLDSLDRQLYQRIHVCVIGSADPGRANVQWLACDPKQPAAAINGLLQGVQSDWFMLVDPGEEFIAAGLLVMAQNLLQAPDSCLAVYADEALRTGGVVDLSLRPDLNLDLLLAFPAGLSRHWMFRRDALVRLNGFDDTCGDAFELAYQLRLISECGMASIGHVSEPLLIANELRHWQCADECAVIDAHLQARGYGRARAIELATTAGRYRIDYGHEQQASVSILIYLEGQLTNFQRCLESLLLHTDAVDFEVLLIEPGNDDPALLEWLGLVERMGEGRFQVLRFMPGQSRAGMCNAAAQDARGEYLLWLDAQSAVLEPGWLQSLLNHAQRPEVGAVGGKLEDSQGRIRQADLVLGLGAMVGRAFEGLPSEAEGYMGRLGLERNCSALGAECLMLRRALFIEAGGFDSDPLLAPWTSVDLCLKLLQAGYLNVWTPYARLLMDSVAGIRASSQQEDALLARWLPQLARDPAYNANFSLRVGEGFVRENTDLCWFALQGSVPRVLVCVTEQQAGAYSRLVQPFSTLLEAGQIEGVAVSSLLSSVEIERLAPTTVVLQRPLDDAGLLALSRLRAFSKAFTVYDLDGYLPQMALKGDYAAEELLERLRYGMMQADRVLVPTPALAELLQGHHDDIRVLETLLPAAWGRVQSKRRTGPRPRLGWLGCKDAQLLADVLPAFAGEVDWVVLGDCPASLQPFLKELHPSVAQQQLAGAMAALNLDLALVPMAENLGNACSGDLRVLQHAACGHPVICSRVPGFIGGEVLPLSRVNNEAQEWIRTIRMHLEDREASATLGDTLQSTVRAQWLLQGERLDAWRRAWLAD